MERAGTPTEGHGTEAVLLPDDDTRGSEGHGADAARRPQAEWKPIATEIAEAGEVAAHDQGEWPMTVQGYAMDRPEDHGNAAPGQTQEDAEFLGWAAGQTFRFGLVDGHRVRLGEEHQGEGRLDLARDIAIRAFGTADAADDWLATATPNFGGLSPADLIAESDEGSRLALLALVRLHRSMLAAEDD